MVPSEIIYLKVKLIQQFQDIRLVRYSARAVARHIDPSRADLRVTVRSLQEHREPTGVVASRTGERSGEDVVGPHIWLVLDPDAPLQRYAQGLHCRFGGSGARPWRVDVIDVRQRQPRLLEDT